MHKLHQYINYIKTENYINYINSYITSITSIHKLHKLNYIPDGPRKVPSTGADSQLPVNKDKKLCKRRQQFKMYFLNL